MGNHCILSDHVKTEINEITIKKQIKTKTKTNTNAMVMPLTNESKFVNGETKATQVMKLQYNKQIKALRKIISNPKMTLAKLINDLISIIIEFDLIVFGGVVMARYSGIPTNDLDIAYNKITDLQSFAFVPQ